MIKNMKKNAIPAETCNRQTMI